MNKIIKQNNQAVKKEICSSYPSLSPAFWCSLKIIHKKLCQYGRHVSSKITEKVY